MSGEPRNHRGASPGELGKKNLRGPKPTWVWVGYLARTGERYQAEVGTVQLPGPGPPSKNCATVTSPRWLRTGSRIDVFVVVKNLRGGQNFLRGALAR